MNDIQLTARPVAEQNLVAFRTFLKNLRNPVYVSNEVLLDAKVIYYQHKSIHQFVTTVALTYCGPNEGSFQLVQYDASTEEMNLSVSVEEGDYSSGRSAGVLTIGNIPGKITRIDLEENSMFENGRGSGEPVLRKNKSS